MQFYEYCIKNNHFLLGKHRQTICDIYIRREALKVLQLLASILPIEKDKYEFRQELFQTCRPFDNEVSQNNIVNGFRSLGSEYELIFNQENLIQETFLVIKEFHKEKKESSLSRSQFEEFILLLR